MVLDERRRQNQGRGARSGKEASHGLAGALEPHTAPPAANSKVNSTSQEPNTTAAGCIPPCSVRLPTTNTKDELTPYASNAATGSLEHERTASHTVDSPTAHTLKNRYTPGADFTGLRTLTGNRYN